MEKNPLEEDGLRQFIEKYGFLFSVAGTIIVLDQITKAIVRANLAIGEMWAPWDWLMPYARIFHVQNEGVAFGMLQGMGGVFAILAIIVAGVIIYAFPRISKSDWVLRLALSMQLAGALGNVIDRLLFNGKVTDFISVGTFAIWNVADASITVGVVLLMIDLLIQEYKTSKNKHHSVISTEGPGDSENSAKEDR